MKVIKLTRSVHLPDRWYLELESGESFRIGLSTIADFSLYQGRELSEAEIEGIRAGASKFSAKERALRLLGNRQMSRRELCDKLREKGEREEDIEETAELMERIGALNDSEYAGAIVRHYALRGYGAGRIRQELMRRGVPKELWDGALAEKPEADDALDGLISRKLKGEAPDKKELKRLTDMLLRRGFNWTEIKEALRRYGETIEEIEE